jgi:hypothetical protein
MELRLSPLEEVYREWLREEGDDGGRNSLVDIC